MHESASIGSGNKRRRWGAASGLVSNNWPVQVCLREPDHSRYDRYREWLQSSSSSLLLFASMACRLIKKMQLMHFNTHNARQSFRLFLWMYFVENRKCNALVSSVSHSSGVDMMLGTFGPSVMKIGKCHGALRQRLRSAGWTRLFVCSVKDRLCFCRPRKAPPPPLNSQSPGSDNEVLNVVLGGRW